MSLIFKLLTIDEWKQFQSDKKLFGNALDNKDGFIHMSRAEQVRKTVERYFASRSDVMLVAVDPEKVVGKIVPELAKNGEYYPHIYDGFVPIEAVQSADLLNLDQDGKHVFPKSIP
jgi:uncharacterized protein (DUF952 family)